MKRIGKQALLLLVTAGILLSLGGCKKGPGGGSGLSDPYAGKTHAEVSELLYEEVLGEFYDYYTRATEAATVSERYALMAIAEAKLLGSGVMLPSTANGGNYAISRVAPRTVTSVLWGSDEFRFHNALVVKGNPLRRTEVEEMKAEWAKRRGTGNYEAWAKSYLKGKGYTLADTYDYAYTADPTTWDWHNTNQSPDFRALVNLYDGLYEYDAENRQMPALATSHEVSEDGLTYTFHIRPGVQWVNYQGTPIEEVTATSFVRGFQHLLDAGAGLEALVDGVVRGVSAYLGDEVTDFNAVGVRAPDRYTLVYELEKPCSYFPTMLSYALFAPISEAYFLANGGAFGRAAFAEAAAKSAYTYGISPEKIAYCGPYLVTSTTAENSVIFGANPAYWNKNNINIRKITWTFVSGQEPTQAYDLMRAGKLSGAGLNANSLAKARENGDFDKYAYVSGVDANAFPVFYNLYRKQYANYNDSTVAVSTLTEDERVRANLAMRNRRFRMALVTSLDRAAENATLTGDDLKYTSLVNSYTPGNFVSLDEDVTVHVGDEERLFPAGTYYGAIVQAQLDADGVAVRVWDPAAEGGAGASTGFDGWYNAENAAAYLAQAVEELQGQGVEISRDRPIVLEMPYCDISEAFSNRANAFKQSVEASLGGQVVIRLVKTGGSNASNWYYAGFYPPSGHLMNYHIFDGCGWGPDYGDPATYLDTMLPQGGGMAKNIGLF